MLTPCATDDDDAWMTECAAPLVRAVTTLALRMLRDLVVRAPPEVAVLDDAAPPEIHEIVVAHGIEVRSPTKLLRLHRRPASTEPPASPRRA